MAYPSQPAPTNMIGIMEGQDDQFKHNQMAPGMPGAYPAPAPGIYPQIGQGGQPLQMPMPGGGPYPPQGGPYPPQGGQYPPQGGSYPPPGANPPGYAPHGIPGAYPQPGQNMVALPPGTATNWMQRPQPIQGCPIGLEYLTQINSLKVKQETSLTEVVVGLDTNNKYAIMNAAGMQCYYAKEESDTCQRICLGAQRSFLFKIFDNMGGEVMRITREYKCCTSCYPCAFCCDCAAYEVVIESPPGTTIGYVKQLGSWWRPKYNILDENHEPILKIIGPWCIMDGAMCCTDNQFKLFTFDGNQIGKVTKKYSGFVRELGTQADNFGIEFPMDLSVKAKASLLGALLLIDFMFFEQPVNAQNRNTGT